jgi:hypothetical protein
MTQKSGFEKQISDYRIEFITTGGNIIPKIDIIDRINKTITPILIIRDPDENGKPYLFKYKEILGDRIHFWKRREIENYFFSYDSIYNSIRERLILHNKDHSITKAKVENKIRELAKCLVMKTAIMRIYQKYKVLPLVTDRSKLRVFLDEKINTLEESKFIPLFYDEFFQEINDTVKKDKIMREVIKEKELLSDLWKNQQTVLENCPGKDLLEAINNWLRNKFQIEINTEILYRNLNADQVDTDIRDLGFKIIRLCKEDQFKYLRQYDFVITKYIDEAHKSLYLNTNYYTSCPAINSSVLYVDGITGGDNSSRRRVITVFDLQRKATINVITIDQDTIISNMVYDPASQLLFAAAGITKNNRTTDTVLIVSPSLGKISNRIALYDEHFEDKEGGLGKLLIHPIDINRGKIYAASVYAQGGNKVLYIITYTIENSEINCQLEKELLIGRDGPIALCIDRNRRKVYALSGDDQEHGSSSIYVIDLESSSIIDKILIPNITPSISPYRGNIMTLDYNKNLLVVIGQELFVIDISTKKILKRLKNFNYQNIVSSNDGKHIYVIISHEDFESDYPYYNCLYHLDSDFNLIRIAKFGNDLDITDIISYGPFICLNATNTGSDIGHSFWLYKVH